MSQRAQTRGSMLEAMHRRPTRARTAAVVVPIVLGLAIAAGYGSRLLWHQVAPAASSGEVTCWDGSGADAAVDCALPSGVKGLAWVFPTFKPAKQDCTDELASHPAFTRATMWSCRQTVQGRAVSITYSQVASVSQTRRTLDRQLGADQRSRSTPRGAGPRFRWQPARIADGRWRSALLVGSQPYLVEVTASTAQDAADVLKRRVRVRPASELLVQPSE
ncbi:hypothetical protein [Nocardioides acrostichi]|uniref:Uncharacterized protein n=1 Tax=Nocardioides acrostichi TaxID=2784339 RepID=A0A930YEP3_9ACTN|nr:hypothetical protein [Nocardioides acrostichi]MBF4163674.1 hypothetical protein [Nocardioides acrostichi]